MLTTAALALLLVAAPLARAQATNATCDPSFSWMDNAENQNPCLVAAYLQGVCDDETFTVTALQPDHHYVGPTSTDESNPCICSSVTYNLIAACTACQEGNVTEKWSSWIEDCLSTDITADGYGKTIPAGTSVPAWALQDVRTSNSFDVSMAYSVYQQHLADIGAGAGNGVLTTKKKSDVAVIAGAAVGGVVVVGAVVVIVVWLVLRARNRRANTPAPFAAHATIIPGPGPTTPGEKFGGAYMPQAEPLPAKAYEAYPSPQPQVFPATGYMPQGAPYGIAPQSPFQQPGFAPQPTPVPQPQPQPQPQGMYVVQPYQLPPAQTYTPPPAAPAFTPPPAAPAQYGQPAPQAYAASPTQYPPEKVPMQPTPQPVPQPAPGPAPGPASAPAPGPASDPDQEPARGMTPPPYTPNEGGSGGGQYGMYYGDRKS